MFAKELDVDQTAFVQECQKMTNAPDKMVLVWWLPNETWLVQASGDPSFTDADAQDIIEVLNPYIIVAAINGKIGKFGGVNYINETTIRNSVKLIDSSGKSYGGLK